MSRTVAALLALGCAACSAEQESPGEPVDYAAINEAAEGPAIAIVLEPIGAADLERLRLSGAECRVLGEKAGQVVIAANEKGAHLALDGELRTLSPHAGSPVLHRGVVSEFDGRTHALEIAANTADAKRPDADTTGFSGTVRVRDSKARVVFDRVLEVRCTP